MATLAEVMPPLRELCASARQCRFIVQSHRVLAAAPDAPELTQMTLRKLAEAGLGGPARELLQLRRDLPVSDTDRNELRQSLAQLPDGRVRWESLRTTFEQNFAALCASRPEWIGRAGELTQQLRRTHLHRTRAGRDLLSIRDAGQLRHWLGPISGGEDEADVALPPREQLGPPAVVGLRDGQLLDTLFDQTANVMLWHSRPLYLIEPDLRRFAAWLHCGDHTRVLAADRTFVFVGPEAVEQLGHALRQNPRLALPSFLVNFDGDTPCGTQLRECLEAVQAERQAAETRALEQVRQRYADRDAAYWVERLRPPGPVLGVTSRYTTMLQYAMRDTLAALEDQGYDTHLLIEGADHELIPRGEILQTLLDVDPAMVTYIDHLRYEYPYYPPNLPFLTWVQDPLPNLLSGAAGASIGTYDMVLGLYRRRCIDEFGYSAAHYISQPVPVSTRVFHDGPLDDTAAATYDCDICFVGHGIRSLADFRDERLREYPAALHPLLLDIYDRVVAALQADEFIDMYSTAGELLDELAGKHGVTLAPEQTRQITNFYLYRLFDAGRREQTLLWVADWARRTGRALRLYGTLWHEHAQLGEFACGEIEHGEPLRQAYRGAKLALQLIPTGFLHQRSHELLMSGTTPITRYCPDDFGKLSVREFCRRRDAGEQVAGYAATFVGLEHVVFHSAEELAELAERLLADEARRREIQTQLCAATRAQYTYDAAMRKTMDQFQRVLATAAEREAASA